tara:strand:- start:270 stop:503 length:234 start_codon:yes stop_codon:yes gene_type:complete
MKASLKVVHTRMEVLKGLELENVSIRHVEFDKLVIKSQLIEFELWHRNIIFEEEHIRINGFALINGIMGRLECVVNP